MTSNTCSWRDAVRAAIGESFVARALTDAGRRTAAATAVIGARVIIPFRWALAATVADDDSPVDERRLSIGLEDAWIARHVRSAASIAAARWHASATASALALMRADVEALTPAQRVRLIGFGITAALATHAALTRFDLFLEGSPWLAGPVAVGLIAIVLLRHPAAIAAAWSHRKR